MSEYVYDPAKGFPRVVPTRMYPDVAGAGEWLSRVYGFTELLRWVDPGGVVRHLDMELDGGIVMLDGGGPDKLPAEAREATLIVLFVGDVDAHYARTVAEAGVVLGPPQDRRWGLRQYTAEDLVGHRWEFTGFLRGVAPHEWGAVTPNS